MQNIVSHDNFLICNTYLNLYDHFYHVIGYSIFIWLSIWM